MADILCVGQLVADILVHDVDQISFDVDTRRVDQIVIESGGDCLNTAIALRKLGADVGCIGILGEDPLGDYLHGVLGDNRIDDQGIVFDNACATSSVVVLINQKGERVFLYYGGANDILTFDKVDQDMVKAAKIVHVGGAYLLPRFDGNGARDLFKLAQAEDAFTTMDVTWDTTGRWMKIIEPCLPYLDLFMPSINEAKEICQTTEVEKMAEVLKGKGVKNVIIKMGKDGSYVDAFGQAYQQNPYHVPVVDTTGAGDSFVAGVLYGLSQGWEIGAITQFASAVSAHCIQALGATNGIPSHEMIFHFMNDNTNEIL